jgi:flagellar motility protein MotE (MotC chaperone)
MKTQSGERGASTIGSILLLIFGGGAVLVVVLLFMTGLAQREIVPRIKARAEQAMAAATQKAQPAPAETAAVAADSTLHSGADSLEALRTQVETQKRFMEEQRQELSKMRGTLDSLVTRYTGGQNQELNRQAKLLAAMNADDAARILQAMDDATVSALLGRMNARAAAKLLPKLDASRVAHLAMAAIGTTDLGAAVDPARAPAQPPATPQ